MLVPAEHSHTADAQNGNDHKVEQVHSTESAMTKKTPTPKFHHIGHRVEQEPISKVFWEDIGREKDRSQPNAEINDVRKDVEYITFAVTEGRDPKDK